MHTEYLAQCWTHRKPSKKAILITTLTIATMLSHKLPVIRSLRQIPGIDCPIQYPFQPFLRPTVPGFLCSEDSAKNPGSAKQMHMCPRKMTMIQIKWQLHVGGSIFLQHEGGEALIEVPVSSLQHHRYWVVSSSNGVSTRTVLFMVEHFSWDCCGWVGASPVSLALLENLWATNTLLQSCSVKSSYSGFFYLPLRTQ